MKSVSVTQWNVSELVRLCLRKHDTEETAETQSEDSEEELEEEDEVVSNLLPMNPAVDLWSNIIAMELPSSHIPSLLEPF